MKYSLSPPSVETLKKLGGALTLTDEISLIRLTIQDLITVMERAGADGRLVMGSMLRDAIEQLSRVIERAARLPATPEHLSVAQVTDMLLNFEEAIIANLPDGPARHHLIMSLKMTAEGISNHNEPQATILRTCEMMDQSVPRVT